MSVPDLRVEDLCVRGGGRTLLDVPRLAADRGEVLAVVGPNGAGKTVLLTTCLGLRKAARGRVTLLGQTVTGASAWALARLRCRVGYVPQELPIHSQMPLTVREVVAIGRTGRAGLLRPLRAADWRVVDEWIDRLGLQAMRRQPYPQLSGGEQRKVLLARALAQEPEMLVLDEPTAYLDLGWREQIVATLDRLFAELRCTIVLVCHELEAIPACCRRVVLLVGGRVVDDGPAERVLTDARVAELYGPDLTALHRGGRHSIVPRSVVTPEDRP